jgi:hypothetical protein
MSRKEWAEHIYVQILDYFIGMDENNIIRKAYVAGENLINYLQMYVVKGKTTTIALSVNFK